MNIDEFLQSMREAQPGSGCNVSFTPRQIRFLAALRNAMGIMSDALEASGVPRRTVYNWLEKKPGFKQACEDVKEEVLDMAENAFFKLVEAGNERAIIFFLKTKGRSRGYA